MRLLVLFCVGVLLALPGRAQERVANVRLRVADSSRLEIRYDLLNARPGDSIYFEIRSRLRGALRILPEFVRGDIGKRITAGSERRIVWDALANGYSLNEEIRATVLVKSGPPPVVVAPRPTEPSIAAKPAEPIPDQKPTVPAKPSPTESVVTTEPQKAPATEPPVVTQTPRNEPKPLPQSQLPPPDAVPERVSRGRYAGPAWALVSVVAPGIGNIFVHTPKPRIGFRPLVTVAAYGLVVYGFMERQKAQDTYAIYQEQKNAAAGEPIYQLANDHHHRYWLATRGAVVLTAADVILTFVKGLRNQQQQQLPRNEGVTLRPGMQAGQPTAVLRYSF
ncbi:hypothetical protein GCM10027341_39960 [Spirosoma knui]